MSSTPAPAGPPVADSATIVQIVVHGPPYAGKTTTARALGERLGQPVETPEEDADGRTLLFDWLEYVGGRHEGRPIRARFVTVPGHDRARSAQLVRTADVVLFVADTTALGIEASAALLDDVRVQVATCSPPPGLMIQANKRDSPDALPMDEVTARLGVSAGEVVVETVAPDGSGVRQAFVFAVREGLKHLLDDEGAQRAHAGSPDDLVRQLRPSTPRPDSLADQLADALRSMQEPDAVHESPLPPPAVQLAAAAPTSSGPADEPLASCVPAEPAVIERPTDAPTNHGAPDRSEVPVHAAARAFEPSNVEPALRTAARFNELMRQLPPPRPEIPRADPIDLPRFPRASPPAALGAVAEPGHRVTSVDASPEAATDEARPPDLEPHENGAHDASPAAATEGDDLPRELLDASTAERTAVSRHNDFWEQSARPRSRWGGLRRWRGGATRPPDGTSAPG